MASKLSALCEQKYCPFCQPTSNRKNSRTRCFRFDNPKERRCWFYKMLTVHFLIKDLLYDKRIQKINRRVAKRT